MDADPQRSSLEAQPGPAAMPASKVTWRFVAIYAFGYTGLWLALLTPSLVSIALRVHQLAPATAKQDLALVISVGALFAVVGNPIFGHLSDRTRSRFGRRRPWMVGGMICGSAALLAISLTHSLTLLLIGWCVAQLAFNAVLASMVAIFPDQIPEGQRGTVSGVIALTLPLGQALGSILVSSFSGSPLLSFMVPAILGTAAVFLFAAIVPDCPHASQVARRTAVSLSLKSLWVDPREHPDFTWACLSRLLLAMGSAFVTTYLPYYLIDKFAFHADEMAGRLSEAVVMQTLLMILFGIVGGRLSDLVRRRKVFVLAGAVLYSVGLLAVANATTYGAFLAGMATMGIGHGIYFGVDLALVSEILRTRVHESGKDLGLLNIANTVPQIVTPAVGSFVLLRAGGDFFPLFIVAAIAAALSAVTILPLRSVR